MAAAERGAPLGTFVGPNGLDAAAAGWDSATLELGHGGRFCLELWRFYESWDYLPEDDGEGAGHVRNEIVDHQDRAMQPREVEEVRVTLTGHCAVRQVSSIQLSGLRRPELNRDFAEDGSRMVNGVPSWWSDDGRAFLYYEDQRNRWQINTVRLAGGDGFREIRPGGRRAGCGHAYSGSVEGRPAQDGWFEMTNEQWLPVSVGISKGEATVVDFTAAKIVVEECHRRGAEGQAEQLVAGPVSFHGWTHSGRAGELRVVLPRIPDRHSPESMETTLWEAEVDGGGTTILGDPDTLILRAASKL